MPYYLDATKPSHPTRGCLHYRVSENLSFPSFRHTLWHSKMKNLKFPLGGIIEAIAHHHSICQGLAKSPMSDHIVVVLAEVPAIRLCLRSDGVCIDVNIESFEHGLKILTVSSSHAHISIELK